jgi:Immunoglobulin I-set domain/Secretion system C-terminal sorting domain
MTNLTMTPFASLPFKLYIYSVLGRSTMNKVLLSLILLGVSYGLVSAQKTTTCYPISLGDAYYQLDPEQFIVDETGVFVLVRDDAQYPSQLFLARLDKQLNGLWKKNLGDPTYYGRTIFKGSNNTAYLVFGNAITKYTSGGSMMYTFYPKDFHDATFIEEDAAGNVVVGGTYFEAGKYYMAVSTYDPTGKFLWLAKLGNNSTSSMYVRGMKVLADGSVFIAAQTNSEAINYAKISAAGAVVFNRKIDMIAASISFAEIAAAQDGFYVLANQEGASPTYLSDVYLYKTDLNGVLVRATKLTAAHTRAFGYAMTLVDNTNPIISTFSYSSANFYLNQGTITKLNSSGGVLWTYNRSNENWYSSKPQLDNAGNVYAYNYEKTIKLSANGVFVDQNIPTYGITSLSITPIGDIYVLSSDYNGSHQDCLLTTIKECSALTITTNIASKSVCPGAATTDLEFVVSGKDLTYRWQKDGELLFDDEKLSGTNKAKLTIKNMNSTDAGSYICVVTDNCSKMVTSATSTLTLVPSLTITTQPASKLICLGASTTLVTAASGGTNIKYQWKKNGVNMADGGNISGTKTSTLTFAAPVAADAATYSCSIVNDCNIPVTTVNATLTTSPATQIIKQPTLISTSENTEVIFSIEAVGTGMTYQWMKNNVNITNGAKYAGIDTPVLSVKEISCSDAGNFSCKITSTCSAPVTSSAAGLTVASEVAITQQPVGQKVCGGQNAALIIQASGNNVTYQWYKGTTALSDGSKYIGAKASVLTVVGVTSTETGSYTCAISGGCASSKTSAAAVIDIANAPTLVSQSPSTSACTGETVKMFVTLPEGTYTYQWSKNGTPVVNSSKVTGATASALFITGVSASDAGQYTARVAGCGSGYVTSSPINVTIIDKAVITTQPTGKDFCDEGEFTLTVAASGTGLKYQWMKSGVALVDGTRITGTKSNTLVVKEATQEFDQGFYSCQIVGDCGAAVTSGVVQVIGNPKPDLFLANTDECIQFTAGIESTLVGDRKNLQGTLSIYAGNSNTPLPNFQSVSQLGEYHIVKTTPATCSDRLTITVSCVVTALEEPAIEVTVSPNPSTGMFTLHTDGNFIGYDMLDARGAHVLDGEINNNNQPVDAQHVADGLYLIVLYDKSGKASWKKLILSK